MNETEIRQLVRDEVLAVLRAQGVLPGVPGTQAPARSSGPRQRLDPRLVAIITAAAVAAMGGRPLRVHRITFLNQNTVSAWAEVGRVMIQSSHNLRRTLE